MARNPDLYLGDPRLKSAGVEIEWTDNDIAEYGRCYEDIHYFIETYMKIVHIDDGIIPFKLYPYQKDVIDLYNENRFVTLKFPRQSGKSITTVAYLLHYIIFSEHKTVGILANRGKTARGILSKLKEAYRLLPFFLQSGVREWNKGSIDLENGCSVFADATSESASRSESISLLVLDEFAFVENTKAEDFMRSVYPTISSGKKSKIFVFSTPHGMNHFYKLWHDAEKGRSSYVPYSIHWSDVPGRDNAFKIETINNIGETAWMQEYECDFIGSGGTLISSPVLHRLVYQVPIHETDQLKMYKSPEVGHHYVCTVDPSEGLGLDYTVISIIDTTKVPYEQVAIWRSNTLDPHLVPDVIKQLCDLYYTPPLLVEVNIGQGQIMTDIMFNTFEYEDLLMTATYGRAGQAISTGGGMNAKFGLKTTTQSKRIGCSVLKSLVESDQLIINDFDTINEMTTFIRHNQTYQADEGCNDDICMSLVIFAWLTNQQYFKDLMDQDIRDGLKENPRLKMIEDSLLPFGHINDGASDRNNEAEYYNGMVW